ncbi:MAG: hypothetical protein K0Q50_212 [Vampirovibrio sp.]|nr:hypothetical protein [Vampirovibrio sp.]
MKLSDKVDKILPALAKIQSEVELKKNKKGYNYKYADLLAVYEAIEVNLTDSGLVVVQTLDDTGVQPDQVLIITRIYHIESGQYVESRLMMLSGNRDPQGLGSAITYGRRYSLLTMFGLCPEDDDAASAMPTKPQAKPTAKPTQKAAAPIQAGEPSPAVELGKLISEACKLAGLTKEEVQNISNQRSIADLVKANNMPALEQAWALIQEYLTKKGSVKSA